jgi:membrane-bound ClpP family serine protease
MTHLMQIPLVQVVLVLIIVGLLLWLINSFIPMASSIKTILNVVVIIAVILWLIDVFRIWSIFHFHSRM